jgi:hypothetical protein
VALQGPIPVEFGLVFPAGVYAAGAFEPVRDFDASATGRFVTGLTVTPYVTQAGRLGYSLKASGIRAPGRPPGRPGPEGRESAA